MAKDGWWCEHHHMYLRKKKKIRQCNKRKCRHLRASKFGKQIYFKEDENEMSNLWDDYDALR
jgi:hypothetical protein